MADAASETYEALNTVLRNIRSILHGAYASAEFYSDKSAELNMVAMAEELTGEAKELADRLYQASRKAK